MLKVSTWNAASTGSAATNIITGVLLPERLLSAFMHSAVGSQAVGETILQPDAV